MDAGKRKARIEKKSFSLTALSKIDNHSFARETKKLFEELYRKRLSPDEVEEIRRNFLRLMRVLKSLSKKGA